METKAFYQLPAPWWKDLLVLFADYSNQREKVIFCTYGGWKLVVQGPGLGKSPKSLVPIHFSPSLHSHQISLCLGLELSKVRKFC